MLHTGIFAFSKISLLLDFWKHETMFDHRI